MASFRLGMVIASIDQNDLVFLRLMAVSSMAIDEIRALELLNGNRELLRELAAIYAEDSIPLVNEFDRAVMERDNQLAIRAIHSLKGITATFVADTEVLLFGGIERSAFHSDWDQLEIAREQIKEAVDSLVRDMHERSWGVGL